MNASTFLKKLSIAEFSNVMPRVKCNGRAAKKNAKNHKPPFFVAVFCSRKRKITHDRAETLGRSFLVAGHTFL